MHNKQEIHLKAENLANTAFNASTEEFLQQMRMMHRTNQQIFAGLVLAWLQDYATYSTDPRNQFSVEYCKKLIEAFKMAYPDEPLRTRFPLV